MYTGAYNGFSDFDDGLLTLLAVFIGVKITELKKRFESEERSRKLDNTINIINTIFEERTYISLIIKLRETLSPLIDFEYVGVYFHDPTCKF